MGSLMPTPYQRLIEFQQLTDRDHANLRHDDSEEFSTFGQVLQAITRNWQPIAVLGAIGLTLGLAAAILQKPVYRAKSVVEMQMHNEDFLNRRQVDPNSEGGPLQAEPYLQTQLRFAYAKHFSNAHFFAACNCQCSGKIYKIDACHKQYQHADKRKCEQ